MKFFDNYNNGNGCKMFFETMQLNGIVDSFLKDYDIKKFIDGECLTTSHIIKRGQKRVRYDFLFINKNKIHNYHCTYDYENAVKSGSDHAIVIVDAD
jgi:hypothetical protein